jgi:hypothetical protein
MVKKKWQDVKSRGGRKFNKNRSATGNVQPEKLSVWEEEVVEFLRERKSFMIGGIPGGFESGGGASLANLGEQSPAPSQRSLFDEVPDDILDAVRVDDPERSQTPLGDVKVLLERVKSSAIPISSRPTSRTSIYVDAQENLSRSPRASNAAVEHQAADHDHRPTIPRPIFGVSVDGTNAITDRQPPRSIQGTDEELFRSGSVAGRKKELEEAHLQYFKTQTEQMRATTVKTKLDIECNELVKKKLEFEVANLEIDKRIKLLKERQLQLNIFKSEVQISRLVEFYFHIFIGNLT